MGAKTSNANREEITMIFLKKGERLLYFGHIVHRGTRELYRATIADEDYILRHVGVVSLCGNGFWYRYIIDDVIDRIIIEREHLLFESRDSYRILWRSHQSSDNQMESESLFKSLCGYTYKEVVGIIHLQGGQLAGEIEYAKPR